MEKLLLDLIVVIPISIGIGIIFSMIGGSGGAFKTPLLIIVFGLNAELSAASSLFSALFIAVVSTAVFYRQDAKPINIRVGLLLAALSIPGSFCGVYLRTLLADAQLLRFTFGIVLFPIALKMLLTRKEEKKEQIAQVNQFRFSQMSKERMIFSIVAVFIGGVLSGLLGLGGGTIIVPVLCIMMQFPMVVAVATSMFTMIFAASAGTIWNFMVLSHFGTLESLLFYSCALGIGMIIGGIIGSKHATRMNAVQLKRIFGFILVFPLVKMMELGQLLFNPDNSSFLLTMVGDIIIWLCIVLPIWFITSHRLKKQLPDKVECKNPLMD